MSEKRFTLDDEENGLCRCILVDGEEIPTCEICELLNNLHQENQQLKHYKLYEDNKRLQTIIADLKEENEQLRQILKDIVGATDETYTKNTSMFKVTVVFDGEMYNQIKSCLK